MNHIYTAEVPSNIAFLKYWGKQDTAAQWPANDSLSMTLSRAKTITSARINPGQDVFVFDGKVADPKDQKFQKAFRHLERIRKTLGTSRFLHIETQNTFPHGCGIASSASGLGALTLACVAALTDSKDFGELAIHGFNLDRLAHLARLGSGSACRSFFGGFVQWQKGMSPEEQRVRQVFDEKHWQLADVIVIVNGATKAVGSTEAHEAAWGSPLFKPRLAEFPRKMERLEAALKAKDLGALGELIEQEALEMHAVAMTGTPSVNYLAEDTTDLLARIRNLRAMGELPAYFTIDAGPNVHLICEEKDAAKVAEKIFQEFPQFKILRDGCGHGPELKRETLRQDMTYSVEGSR